MKRLLFSIFLCLLIGLAVSSSAQEKCGSLLPIDEGSKDVSFLFFRDRLLKALNEKDPSALRAFLASKVKTSFGSEEALAKNFYDRWTADNPSRDLWKELGAALALGGSFENPKTFEAPYVFSKWEKATSCDPLDHGVILEKDVKVLAAPKSETETLTTLSHAVVPFETLSQNPDWVKISFGFGKNGYVPRSVVRSPLDYRAIFKKEKGAWVMTAFVSGD